MPSPEMCFVQNRKVGVRIILWRVCHIVRRLTGVVGTPNNGRSWNAVSPKSLLQIETHWVIFLRNELFGNAFNLACKDGWNRGMKALMDAPKENGDTGPGYEWRSHRPTTRNEILELLRSDEMVNLATKGEIVEVTGFVFKWGHG